ncbi:MAG: hypothetical protein ACT4OF_01040 [Caulobacteraceae bacterium]
MRQAFFAALFVLAGSQTLASAQDSPADALAACVVRSASGDDSVTLARWLFIAMSRHPSLSQTVQVSDADGLDANRRMGALFNRLLFEACTNETRAAFQSAGREEALAAAFGALGEQAMTELMGNPDVLASVIQLGAYVDRERLEALGTTP